MSFLKIASKAGTCYLRPASVCAVIDLVQQEGPGAGQPVPGMCVAMMTGGTPLVLPLSKDTLIAQLEPRDEPVKLGLTRPELDKVLAQVDEVKA